MFRAEKVIRKDEGSEGKRTNTTPRRRNSITPSDVEGPNVEIIQKSSEEKSMTLEKMIPED